MATCVCCGKIGPLAADQTDPAADEITLDAAGICRANEYVCGECLAEDHS